MEQINWVQVGVIGAAIAFGAYTYYLKWKASSEAEKMGLAKDVADQVIRVVVREIDRGEKDNLSTEATKDNIKLSPDKSPDAEEYLHRFVQALKKPKGG